MIIIVILLLLLIIIIIIIFIIIIIISKNPFNFRFFPIFCSTAVGFVSEMNTQADNERIKTILVTSTAARTVATVCDRTSYPVGSELMFLKNDGKL